MISERWHELRAAARHRELQASGEFPDFGDEPLAPGDRVGAFVLLRPLARGGMSTVFLAAREDEQYEHVVALKVVRLGFRRQGLERRFRRERQILASLDHPHIARLFDGGTTEDGRPYFVMEAIDGEPLHRYCERVGPDLEERIRLVRQVCSAVHYAHQRLLVHRDLKPGNILVDRHGATKLLDFGIAKVLAPESWPGGDEFKTTTGYLPLTPRYASPEQLAGGRVTTATDVYALGLVLYELLTGQLPERRVVPGAPPAELPRPSLVARRTRPGMARRLAGDLDNILLTALRLAPEHRYSSAEQLSDDLGRYLEGRPVRARGDSLPYRAGKFVRRHFLAVAAVAALVTSSLAFGSVMTYQAYRIGTLSSAMERERDKARQVSDFLVDVFERSDPELAGGETVNVRELMERGTRRVTSELAGQPDLQAAMLDAAGNVLANLGLYDRARPPLEQALELRRALPHATAADLGRSWRSLGLLELRLGHYDDAERMLRQAMERRREAFGAATIEVAAILVDLGEMRARQGRYQEAAGLFGRALEIQRQALGERAPEVAETLGDLAEVRNQMGDRDGAADLFRKSLEILEASASPKQLQLAKALENYATVLLVQRRLDEAESALDRALEIRQGILGPDHPTLGSTVHNLAAVHLARRDFPEAKRLLERSIRIHRAAYGDAHLYLAIDLSLLARLLKMSGDVEGARRSWEESLAIGRRVQPEGYPDFAYPLLGLGGIALDSGDLRAARGYLREAYDLRRAGLPEGSRLIAQAAVPLADCLLRTGERAEAEKLLLEHLPGLGPEAPTRRRILALLVRLYESAEDRERAARYRGELEAMPPVPER